MTQRPNLLFALFGALILAHGAAFGLHGTEPNRVPRTDSGEFSGPHGHGQKKLRRHNRNAAPAEGDTASSHLAGLTVDLQRRGMSKQQVRFVERYLFYLRELGLVEPEEERRHWCFHVMVSDRYADWRQSQTVVPHLPAQDTEVAVTGSN